MRRKGSECTRISPEIGTGTPVISMASGSGRRAAPDRERPPQVRGAACGSRLFRSARWTAARFYRRARASVVTAFRRSASTRKTAAAASSPECTPARRSSRRQSAAPVVSDDSHKSEAVEECIRFMNSSSRKYR